MTPKDWDKIEGMIEASEAAILAKLGEGVTAKAVKSVQSGIYQSGASTSNRDTLKLYSTQGYSYYVDITISEVADISKCQVRIDTFNKDSESGNAIGKFQSKTKLRVYVSTDTDTSGSHTVGRGFRWEVTEFY